MILRAQPKNDAGCSIHENADTGPSLRRDRHTERSVCGLLKVHTLVLTRFVRGGENQMVASIRRALVGEATQHAMTVFPAGRLDRAWGGLWYASVDGGLWVGQLFFDVRTPPS